MNREQRRAFEKANGRPPAPEEQAAHDGNAQPAAGVGIAPLPVQTAVGVADGPEPRVLVQFATPQGLNVFFLAPEHARELAAMLLDAASTTASGLTVARDLAGVPAPPMGATS